MQKQPSLRFLVLTALSAAALSACQAPPKKVVFPIDDFTSTDVFAQSFPGSEQEACEAGRRALLSQGYVINETKPAQIKGRKNFQPDGDIHMQIEFHVVCAPNARGSNSSTVFANAVRDRYSLKKSKESASIGVGMLGSVSLPFSTTDDSLVRVGSETIPTKQFYGRFFSLLERFLDNAYHDDGEESDAMEKAERPLGR